MRQLLQFTWSISKSSETKSSAAPTRTRFVIRIEIDDVARLSRTSGQTFALTDGEKLDAAMFAEKISLEIVNGAGVKLFGAKMRSEESFVIVPGHETDFLTVHFVGDLQA